MAAMNQTGPAFAVPNVAPKGEDSYISGVRDFYLLLALPPLAYWVTGTFYFLLEKSGRFEQYRIHTPEEFLKRNKVSLKEVFRSVISQQLIQIVFGLSLDYLLSSGQPADTQPVVPNTEHQLLYIRHTLRMLLAGLGLDLRRLALKIDSSISSINGVQLLGSEMALANFVYWIGIPACQFTGAILLADFWQYALHRIFHESKFLYKHVHSYHHRIYVPYAYGALYNTMAEAFVGDAIGTTIVFWLTGLTDRQAIWFATISITKAVHDHSGYELPGNPLDMISKNNPAYHDIHHQSWGAKHNYSQVYLTFWDDVLGTTMSPEMAQERYEVQKARLKEKAT